MYAWMDNKEKYEVYIMYAIYRTIYNRYIQHFKKDTRSNNILPIYVPILRYKIYFFLRIFIAKLVERKIVLY